MNDEPATYVCVVDGRVRGPVRVATTRAQRRRGLLGSAVVAEPMWFPQTRAIHTFAMSVPIDVVYVDRGGVVLSVVPMVPWRIGRPRLRARAVIEFALGGARSFGVVRGSRVEYTGAVPEVR